MAKIILKVWKGDYAKRFYNFSSTVVSCGMQLSMQPSAAALWFLWITQLCFVPVYLTFLVFSFPLWCLSYRPTRDSRNSFPQFFCFCFSSPQSILAPFLQPKYMASPTLFKKCIECGVKISPSDHRCKHLYCVEKTHLSQNCSVSKAFTKAALKNGLSQLKLPLWQNLFRLWSLLANKLTRLHPPICNPRKMQVTFKLLRGLRPKRLFRLNHNLLQVLSCKAKPFQNQTPLHSQGRGIEMQDWI